jgi:hypothetical protein
VLVGVCIHSCVLLVSKSPLNHSKIFTNPPNQRIHKGSKVKHYGRSLPLSFDDSPPDHRCLTMPRDSRLVV